MSVRIAVLAGAIGIALCPPVASAATPSRPNILVVITDQQPIPTIGAYGNPQVRTPNIDRLAREGLRFDEYHIAAFACCPSRACYWTGRWSHHHGVITNEIVLRDDIPTLGSVVRAAGYQAAFVGKWHLGGNMYVTSDKDKWSLRRVENSEDYAFDRLGPWRGGEDEPQGGFLDKWVGGWRQYQDYLRGVGLGKFGQIGCHNMAPSGPDDTHAYSRVPAVHHEAAFLAGEAEKFIRQQRDPTKPFCLVLSIYGPHHPVAPPKPWDTMYDPRAVPLPENFRDELGGKPLSQRDDVQCRQAGRWSEAQFRDYIARYWGYCSYIDDQVGRVVKALDDEKILDNTIVVYTTDHGDMLAAHGFVFKLGSGYDELMRVPLVIRYPKAIRPGQTDALVQNIDLLPTLLELCRIAVPPQVDGRSFAGLLAGKATAFRDQVVTVMLRTIMLATRDWKLVYTNCRQTGAFLELYDRHQRPLEVDNRAGRAADAEAFRAMKARLSAWLHESGYPYAAVIDRALPTARTRMPSIAELLRPQIASFRASEDAQGKPVAEFTVAWNVGEPPASRSEVNVTKYWTFVHVLGPGMQEILSRATRWPDPPTTSWAAGSRQVVGPLRVPIPFNLQGRYPVRVGLFSPETKTCPKVLGEAQRVVGKLTVDKPADGLQRLSFEPVRDEKSVDSPR
jgi:arylsulfatase A-like enzyme